MKTVYSVHPNDVSRYSAEELHERFVCSGLFQPGTLQCVYFHTDRLIVGGAMPASAPVALDDQGQCGTQYFLERREIGIVNVGGPGAVVVGTARYALDKLSCLYVGPGNREVSFVSADQAHPAKFYFVSTLGLAPHPTELVTPATAFSAEAGDPAKANARTLYRFIHRDGIRSNQLLLGLTVLKSGSVWNTMPPHLHDRRTEVYFYFDLAPDDRVFHFMGEPRAIRPLVLANEEAVLSPPWSIHSGVGTGSYAFIWAMGGENDDYADMAPLVPGDLH
ncbi:MAG: 5-dehydro-4-deoxy-D-glucuronate isomerase [Firmicutes bacterium]|nr:5-dehydro-4-deoxy-D-glucuronate isomerase [Bacillota bacterium]